MFVSAGSPPISGNSHAFKALRHISVAARPRLLHAAVSGAGEIFETLARIFLKPSRGRRH